MEKITTCQGRPIGQSEILWLNAIVRDYPDWSRHKITKHICTQWDWKTHNGTLKTFAARSLIDKLEQQGYIKLPPIQTRFRRPPRPLFPKDLKVPPKEPVYGTLNSIAPLTIVIPISNSYDDHCFCFYLKNHHYLSFNKTVGENLKYIVRDKMGRDIACLLFGSAAWKTAPRDSFIGWDAKTREQNVNFLTNNTRFLIFPWVQIPHLASHLLGLISRRIKRDWIDRYGHPVHLLETFVESSRFQGTCYNAANWISVGKTKGRSRQDQKHRISVPIKDIWLYPLTRNFQRILCNDATIKIRKSSRPLEVGRKIIT